LFEYEIENKIIFSSCDICYTEGPQALNWAKIMKTITDDLSGFFAQGGWTFLEADGDDAPEDGVVDESDIEEDDYNPEEEGSGEDGSEDEYSGEEEEEEDEDFKNEESDSGIFNSK
jgi:nucleosome binding factor SPN SPT16 subunit